VNGFLLDTNVVSELTKDVPDSQVIAFLAAQNDLWLSIIVLHELDFGLNLLPLGRCRDRISTALAALVVEYEDRILPIDRPQAEQAASLRAQAHRSGRVLHLGDALIAGTAKIHNLAVATRNVADFAGLDVDVTNPWEAM
jgi:predicted nucleic acid-binding protein